jgi:hypothetical protein
VEKNYCIILPQSLAVPQRHVLIVLSCFLYYSFNVDSYLVKVHIYLFVFLLQMALAYYTIVIIKALLVIAVCLSQCLGRRATS